MQGNPARGEYVEIDPPRRVVFTWGIEGRADFPPGSSTVEVVLQADGDETVVTLTHRDLPTEDYRRSHQGGWGEFLGVLAAVAGRFSGLMRSGRRAGSGQVGAAAHPARRRRRGPGRPNENVLQFCAARP